MGKEQIEEIYLLSQEVQTWKNLYSELLQKHEDTISLLRQTTMRANICFPETEEDNKWFNEQFYKNQEEFMPTLFKSLGLAMRDDEPKQQKQYGKP